ncbi:MAG: tellurite resistance TerB family protein [Pseudomonadota bacterium]
MNLDKIVKNLAGSGVLGGFAGGAVSGALMSNKKTRKVAGTALKVGGLAALGGLAWKAYQGYQAEQQNGARTPTNQTPVDESVWRGLTPEGFDLDPSESQPDSRALLMVQAMIAAAYADGHMDTGERERILQQVDAMQLDREEKALAFDALSDPLSLKDLCARVDCPEVAAEVYLASLMAMDRERLGADIYLEALSFRLGLPQPLVDQLHASLPVPEQSAVA